MILATKAAIAHSAPVPTLDYRWIIAGQSGTLKTSDSTTADTWTTRTSSFSSTQINGVASNGSDLYVAVGESGKLATSPDGITWTQQTSSFSSTGINGIAYGNGIWVAVGDSGKIATSTDGTTWTQRTSGTAQDIFCVAYGNGIWVVGGQSPRLTATDPTGTWTSRTATVSSSFYNNMYYWPEQSIWVAGWDSGTTGALESSTDGITWTSRNSAFTINYGLNAFTSTGSVLVMGSTTDIFAPTCDVQSSTNGTSWTNRTPAQSSTTIYSSAVDDAGFMILAGGRIQSTTDGTTWTDRAAGINTSRGCCHSSGVPAIR